VDLWISELTVFSALKIDDHTVTLGVLPCEMGESLTELRFFTHITFDDISSVVIVFLEITFHEIFDGVEV